MVPGRAAQGGGRTRVSKKPLRTWEFGLVLLLGGMLVIGGVSFSRYRDQLQADHAGREERRKEAEAMARAAAHGRFAAIPATVAVTVAEPQETEAGAAAEADDEGCARRREAVESAGSVLLPLALNVTLAQDAARLALVPEDRARYKRFAANAAGEYARQAEDYDHRVGAYRRAGCAGVADAALAEAPSLELAERLAQAER
jgi:hypothetical protein